MKLPLEAGADLEAKTDIGNTPLHLAAWDNNNSAVAKLLLEAGTDPTARNDNGETPWDKIRESSWAEGTEVWERLREANE